MSEENMEIRTTTVGSYAQIDWLHALPSEQALLDAKRVVFATQRERGIDMPTDGELGRFDVNHPDTNGMIEYFIGNLGGISTAVGRHRGERFRARSEMSFRRKPAGVVIDALSEGRLDLLEDCRRSQELSDVPFRFTVTSPFMLARTLEDEYYGNLEELTLALADVLAGQVRGLPCGCLQVDEANVPGCPEYGPLAAEAINRLLDAADTKTAVHFCFGNYGGQSIQQGEWKPLIDFLNRLHCDHLVMEAAHRSEEDLRALAGIDPRIGLGIGVIDIKVNHVETPDEVAARIEKAVRILGAGRVRWVHPDCGFWMLKRSVADRKIEALVRGRDLFLGLSATRPDR